MSPLKKFLSLLLTLAMLLSLAACGGDNTTADDDSDLMESHSSDSTETDSGDTTENDDGGEAASQTALSSLTVLPDLALFLGCERKAYELGYHDHVPYDDQENTCTYTSYLFALNDAGLSVEAEVLELLQEEQYQLELSDCESYDKDDTGRAVVRCYFNYTGTSAAVNSFEYRDTSCDVCLEIDYIFEENYMIGEGYIVLIFCYADAFIPIAPVSRVSVSLTDYSNGVESDTSSDDDTQTVSGPVLPDINAFGGGAMELDSETIYSTYTRTVYFYNYNGKFVNEYLELLSDYGFTLRDSHSTAIFSDYINEYTYDYIGDGETGSFSIEKSKIDTDNITLYIWEYGSEFHIYYADGLTVADTGDRTTQTLTPYTSGDSVSGDSTSSDSGSSYVPNCAICNGTGKCQTCGGDGYLYSSASGKEDRNCTSCNTTGKCIYCNGTGKRY